MLEIECLSADRCTVDHFPNERDVVRVHPVDDDIDRSSDRGIILEYSAALLGPEDFSARDVPAKTARVAEPLRLGQISLALSQCVFGLLAILDIESHRIPLHNVP